MTTTAIVGATLIDGNGGPPRPSSVVLIDGESVAMCGDYRTFELPEGCDVVDASGKFIVPGFVDTNVHLTPFYYFEELVLYRDRYQDIALETAQMLLRSGVTTVRDSYGHLPTLISTRTAIDREEYIGPRVHIAGNIIGWGALGSMTFDVRGPHMLSPEPPGLIDARSSLLLETIQDEFTQGVGEELIDLEPGELRQAICRYLMSGVDFLKYGGTTHGLTPSLILFSPDAQRAIIDEAHEHGKRVDTHATSPEGLHIAVRSGVDVVQHPETTDVAMSDDLAQLHATNEVVCSMNVNRWTGRLWQEQLARASTDEMQPCACRAPTAMERRLAKHHRARTWWRTNALKLIDAGCTISVASDTLTLPPVGVLRGNEPYAKTFHHHPGASTLDSIEGLVEVGMSPMDALVAATKNGAVASGALDEYGTIESGKSADLVILEADPLQDIANIRTSVMVFARGRLIDHTALPNEPVYYTDAK